MIEITSDRWDQFYPACLPLFKEHNDEIGELNKNMPLDPDVATCKLLSDRNLSIIMVARKEGLMIGYCVFTLGNNLMSKNVLCGTQSIFFVTKEERKSGVGLNLYREAIKYMKVRGVKNIYPHHWMRGDSPLLAKFFEHLGAVEIQHEYSLWIGE